MTDVLINGQKITVCTTDRDTAQTLAGVGTISLSQWTANVTHTFLRWVGRLLEIALTRTALQPTTPDSHHVRTVLHGAHSLHTFRGSPQFCGLLRLGEALSNAEGKALSTCMQEDQELEMQLHQAADMNMHQKACAFLSTAVP